LPKPKPEPEQKGWLERLRGRPAPSGGKDERSDDHEEDGMEEASEGEVYEPDELAEKVLNLIRNGRPMNLEEAVRAASSAFGAKPEEVAKRIYLLREAGMASMKDADPPLTLPSYVKSPYSAWFWALVGLVCASVALVYFSPGPLAYLRYALGSLFVLYLPGSALIELLYPKRKDLSQLERVALSLGLSLALVPLVGLLLNYTPWGIRLDPIVVSLSILTVGLAAGAVIRKFGYLKLEAAGRHA